MMGRRSGEERRLLSKSVEPDYGDEEVHLSPESIIGPDTTFRYLDKRRVSTLDQSGHGRPLSRPDPGIGHATTFGQADNLPIAPIRTMLAPVPTSFTSPADIQGKPYRWWSCSMAARRTLTISRPVLGMNVLAERELFFVVYPQQASSANPSNCWNWFQARDQQRGHGEPSIIAGLTQEIIRAYHLNTRRVYVVGLSAGGAMAAILGITYPDLMQRSASIRASRTGRRMIFPPPTRRCSTEGRPRRDASSGPREDLRFPARLSSMEIRIGPCTRATETRSLRSGGHSMQRPIHQRR